jgi:thiamine monophosphate kinase
MNIPDIYEALDLIDTDHARETIALLDQLSQALSLALIARDDYELLMTDALGAERKLRQAVTAADTINLRLANHAGQVGKSGSMTDPTESDTP